MEGLLTPYWLEIAIKFLICFAVPLALFAIGWAIYDIFKPMEEY